MTQTSPNKMCKRCGHFKSAFESGLCIKCTGRYSDDERRIDRVLDMRRHLDDAEIPTVKIELRVCTRCGRLGSLLDFIK